MMNDQDDRKEVFEIEIFKLCKLRLPKDSFRKGGPLFLGLMNLLLCFWLLLRCENSALSEILLWFVLPLCVCFLFVAGLTFVAKKTGLS